MIDYDKVALDYAQHRRVHPEVLRGLLSTSAIGSSSRVLEVGCGTGNYIMAMETHAGCSCWGIDPSAEMLSRARQRSEKVNFQLGQAERIDLASDFFDLVFSVDVIHHIENRLAYFREAYRLLTANGKICTVTDSSWIIRHRQPLAVYFPETVKIDLHRYSRIADLREAMKKVGFSDYSETTVEHPYRVTDIEAYRDKAFSSLQLISEKAHREGIERMEKDLRTGPIPSVSRYLLLWGIK
jgi:ubiquinone/menaquinone biosynthesis C-methylase UbiE